MASTIYPEAREAALQAGMGLTGDVRVIAVDTAGYTYNASHDFLDDVPVGARVAISAALTGKTYSGGVFDADNVTLPAVSGDSIEALIVYVHTGNESTSRLVAYIDTASSGLPLTPNGGDITVSWHPTGIFAL